MTDFCVIFAERLFGVYYEIYRIFTPKLNPLGFGCRSAKNDLKFDTNCVMIILGNVSCLFYAGLNIIILTENPLY